MIDYFKLCMMTLLSELVFNWIVQNKTLINLTLFKTFPVLSIMRIFFNCIFTFMFVLCWFESTDDKTIWSNHFILNSNRRHTHAPGSGVACKLTRKPNVLKQIFSKVTMWRQPPPLHEKLGGHPPCTWKRNKDEELKFDFYNAVK